MEMTMPAYNFQSRFVPMILDGSKPHTIRRRRKRPTKVGDMLCLYTGMRTKQCKLIVVTECVKVEPITICPFKNHLASPINVPIDEFVHNDGFESVDAFFEFFRRYKAECLNDFEIIHWNTKLMVSGEAGEIRLQLGGDVSGDPLPLVAEYGDVPPNRGRAPRFWGRRARGAWCLFAWV